MTAYITTSSRISYAHAEDEQDLYLFPPGTVVPYGGPPAAFPEGMRGAPLSKEWDLRLEKSIFFTGLSAHDIRLDIGIHYGELYGIEEQKNFDSFGQPLSGFIDVSDTPSLIYMTKQDQLDRFIMLQDRWYISSDWDITLGARVDDFSDFGTSVNPRIALVWQQSFDSTIKLLYGSAFRAPSFVERYIINNPVIVGNPSLEPETIDSYDISFIKRIDLRRRLEITLFHNELDDLIQTAPHNLTQLTFVNSEERESSGLEVQYEHNMDTGRLIANFSHQKVETDSNQSDLGNYPQNDGSLRYSRNLSNNWHYSMTWNWISSRARSVGDTREKLEGYHTADIKMGRTFGNGNSLSLLVKNIANTDMREPSTLGLFLPNDIPTGKRLAMIEFQYNSF